MGVTREKPRSPEAARKQSDYHRRWKLRTRYGITPERYDEMLAEQNNRCAICGGTDVRGTGANLSVDHNHRTGEVRGLLCQPCNLALGHLEEYLSKAFVYLGGDDVSRN